MAQIFGTPGGDDLTGTQHNDLFHLEDGGEDDASGLGGRDTFLMGDGLDAGDHIDGGTGANRMLLAGDYSAGVTFNDTTIENISLLRMSGAFSYNLTTADGNVAAGAWLTVDARSLASGDALTFDGSDESDGHFTIIGGAGDDDLTGGAHADVFVLTKGGEDTADGGGGNDRFYLGGTFDANDAIDGGSGQNLAVLNGDYASLTLGTETLLNIQTLRLKGGSHDYNITSDQATVASGQMLTVNAVGAESVTFNGAAETDGHFHFITGLTASAGDSITGGDQADTFDLQNVYGGTFNGGSGDDVFNLANDPGTTTTLNGGAGADIFHFNGGGFSSDVNIDGGGDYDTLQLDGDFTLNFVGNDAMVNVDEIDVAAGHNYSIETANSTIASGATLKVDGSLLGSSDTLTVIPAGETDGNVNLIGGAGNDHLVGTTNTSGSDTISGGDGADLIRGQLGGDTLSGGSGSDTFQYVAAAESTDTAFDTITDADFSSSGDVFSFGNAGGHMTVDSAITFGHADSSTFTADIETWVGSSFLAANDCVLWTPTTGNYAGHSFLVVDANGTAGFQTGADFVIDVTGYSGTLDANTDIHH